MTVLRRCSCAMVVSVLCSPREGHAKTTAGSPLPSRQEVEVLCIQTGWVVVIVVLRLDLTV